MEAKLIKTKTGFYLWKNPLDKSQEILGATVPIMNDNGVDLREYKLSLKNCEAIANGYDLDELAKKHYNDHIKRGHTEEDSLQRKIDFILGFQKALEILGDKKFSEVDVLKVVTHVLNELVLVDGFDKQYLFPESIYQETTTKCKSLQQTEWEVEILEIKNDEVYSVSENMKVAHNKAFDGVLFKYDADGCLILRRI